MGGIKNKRGVLAIAIIAVIGFSLGALEGGADPVLNGTWVFNKEDFKFTNGNFEASSGGRTVFKGTYTASNGKITMTISQIHGSQFGGKLESKWYTRSDLKSRGVAESDLKKIFTPAPGTYSISGNKLTLAMSGPWGTKPYTYTRKS